SRARLAGLDLSGPHHRRLVHTGCTRAGTSDSKAVELVLGGRCVGSHDGRGAEDAALEMMDRVPKTMELTDPEERRAKMRELLTKYKLVCATARVESEQAPEGAPDSE
ncbi:hypothetical protein ACJX0J_030382, partial [Zea mays]